MRPKMNRTRESRGQYIKYYRIPTLKDDIKSLHKRLKQKESELEDRRQEVKDIEKDMKCRLKPVKDFIEKLKMELPRKEITYPKFLERSRL